MKILLVGEYSRLHNSLKEGLLELGHEVCIISTGDYFKKYPADIMLEMKYNSGFSKYLKRAFYKLFATDITSNSVLRQFLGHADQLKGYDVVQLINESPFGLMPYAEKKIIAFLREHNKKLFLLSCGTDYLSVQYALSDALPYNILHDYKSKNLPRRPFRFILKYTRPDFKKLHELVYSVIDGVMASDMDYHLPLKDHPLYKGLIPNPVNTQRLKPVELNTEGPVVIFMGINRDNYHSKGIRYFEEALEIIKEEYQNKIEIQVVENLPYDEYIEKFNRAHILLDQVLAYDQGYNALEAMAKGKVVFTGAEKVFESHYYLQDPVAVNATPDTKQIVRELKKLIDQPELISKIGRNARDFVDREHDYIRVAEKYLAVWNDN
jgi:glycosyltransferase involved in cell wall biosynthesis